MNELAASFKPTDVVVNIGGADYRLIYDLNAFCELEKIYESVDSVLQMLLGASAAPDLEAVTFKGEKVDASEIMIAETPLTLYINKLNKTRDARNTDTLNLLWAGVLHDKAKYDQFGEITGYTVTRAQLGAGVTFKNLREINAKILTAILRDLLPSDNVKNAETPEVQEATGQKLTLHK